MIHGAKIQTRCTLLAHEATDTSVSYCQLRDRHLTVLKLTPLMRPHLTGQHKPLN